MKKFPVPGVYPVIHRNSDTQSIRAAVLAHELGAKGAFIIDHRSTLINPNVLFETYQLVKAEVPDLWLGINNLGLSASKSMAYAQFAETDGVWADNAMEPSASLEHVDVGSATIYFGGLAMKGAGYIEDPQGAADCIYDNYPLVDVAVTSGPSTGVACPPERLEAIRTRSPHAKLAIASGVDLDNVERHSRLVDYILVSSSVETYQYSGEFDEQALSELIGRDAEVRAV